MLYYYMRMFSFLKKERFNFMKTKHFNISRLILDVLREVQPYKWIESEKRGYDIGWEVALREWIEKYYDKWFEANKYKYYNGD